MDDFVDFEDPTLFADDYNVYEEQQVFLDGVAGEFSDDEDDDEIVDYDDDPYGIEAEMYEMEY